MRGPVRRVSRQLYYGTCRDPFVDQRLTSRHGQEGKTGFGLRDEGAKTEKSSRRSRKDPKAAPRPVTDIRKDIAMPKIKTNRAAAKRFRKTASGKYKAGHANKSHILTKKPTQRKRNLRQTNHVRAEDAGRLDRMLPYL